LYSGKRQCRSAWLPFPGWRWCWGGGGGSVSRPDQHFATLIHGKLEDINDFVSQDCQEVIVQLEL
jgi:hypothetical protein